jgi:hypothetical protein
LRDGKQQGSVVSTQTADSFAIGNKAELWRTIGKELQGIGITVEAFNTNKEFVFEWFLEALQTGAFEEQIPDNVSVVVTQTTPSGEFQNSGDSILTPCNHVYMQMFKSQPFQLEIHLKSAPQSHTCSLLRFTPPIQAMVQ